MSSEKNIAKNIANAFQTRKGSLAELITQFELGSWRTSKELFLDILADPSLITKASFFYPANFAMYTLEKGEVYLYFGQRPANPIFYGKNLSAIANQLINSQDYTLSSRSSAMKEAILSVSGTDLEKTLKVNLSDLELGGEGNLRQFCFYPENYSSLNNTQQNLLERIFGSMKIKAAQDGEATSDFDEVMHRLSAYSIKEIKISMLSPEYVKEHISRKTSGIVRACWFAFPNKESSFNVNAFNFSAAYHCVYEDEAVMRGISKPSCSGNGIIEEDSKEIIEPAYQQGLVMQAFECILQNKERALREMTPEVAVRLQGMLIAYSLRQYAK